MVGKYRLSKRLVRDALSDVLGFLTDTLAGHRRGHQGPSLLPHADAPQLALVT
ncbi:hypothetical protein [Myxococcus fulvus]|uniref:hypothetical protein n=1 Tax=Myxococcus fulvus TaxID=33 RepID=UPI0020BE7982|nr:hypothetical protein [Myxococcus fulvus]MCK8502481.1 hypothetical protein [Myxococcus fulvus]